MIELARHIETLLLRHNCVIVPNLGGFVAHYVPARHMQDENLFLPPHRNIGFNPQLTLNDGLLVQSYMQAYDTNYPDTLRLIDDAVSALKQELQAEGEFRLNGIGTLTLDIDGKYNFIPNEAGVLSPELYGLDSFVTKVQSEKEVAQAPQSVFVSERENRETRSYTLHISKELVNYAAAIVVAILFYFVWATPISDTTTLTVPQEASMNLPMALPSSAKAKAAASEELPEAQSETAEPSSQSACQQVQEEAEGPCNFSIVLLSSVPKQNAEKFVETLHEEGLSLAFVKVTGKMVRVLYGGFGEASEAYGELNRLRQTNKYFHEAWVMEMK